MAVNTGTSKKVSSIIYFSRFATIINGFLYAFILAVPSLSYSAEEPKLIMEVASRGRENHVIRTDIPETFNKSYSAEELKLVKEVASHIRENHVIRTDVSEMVNKSIDVIAENDLFELTVDEDKKSGVINIYCSDYNLTFDKSSISWENVESAFKDLYHLAIRCSGNPRLLETKQYEYLVVKSMLSSLGTHSSFITPKTYADMRFGGAGIGIGMTIQDEVLTVIRPIQNTPAWKAGIKSGDKILMIDGESTSNMAPQEARSRLRGPKGTTVTITIERGKSVNDYTIVRDTINVKDVTYRILEGNIGFIRINWFAESTYDNLGKVLDEIKGKTDAIILDLRDNTGGLFTSIVEVASYFIPWHKSIGYTKGRYGKKKVYRSKWGKKTKKPLVVLVNEGTAAGSEIIVSALKEWKKAIVLGSRTAGILSIQSLIPLSDGSALKLTTAIYYSPSGNIIDNVGIAPDIDISSSSSESYIWATTDAEDDQLRYAIKILKEQMQQ